MWEVLSVEMLSIENIESREAVVVVTVAVPIAAVVVVAMPVPVVVVVAMVGQVP